MCPGAEVGPQLASPENKFHYPVRSLDDLIIYTFHEESVETVSKGFYHFHEYPESHK